jgi:dTDP-4-dehydrorhamnose reductase
LKILLTGSNGQVGWELQRALAPLGEIIACDRAALDLADRDRIRSVVRSNAPDLIVNAAAYTAVDRAESEHELADAVNGVAPGILAEEALRLGAALVHYSTDYVFDGMKADAYVEDDATHPLNAYGRSKLAGENAIRQVGGAYLILRTSWIYAARGRNFFLSMRRLLAEKETVRVVSDQDGAPTSASALAEATAQILERHGLPGLRERGGVFHATASGSTSWYGFAQEIARKLQPGAAARLVPVSSAEYASVALRPKNSRLSNQKLKRRYAVELPSWQDCLEHVHAGLAGAHAGTGA